MKMMKKIASISLCLLLSLSFCGCTQGSGATQGTGFNLSHFDGSDLSNGYDTDLLYKNNSNLLGGDSGVIWVSEEQDPVYGGYFYQYQSSTLYVINEATGSLSGTPSTEDGRTPENNNDVAYISHIATTRSKDLNDWKLCGAIDNGMSLKLEPDCWIYSFIWSPEVIYDPVSGKYFMYFNAGTARDTNHFYLQAAISDTPVGPFELITSENYYGDAAAKNPNGQVLTYKEPTIDFKSWYGLSDNDPEYEYVADVHPMLDENGDLYLYFIKRSYNPVYGYSCWGMKMKDFATPDYSTITCLMYNSDSTSSWAPVRSVYKGDRAKNAPITEKDEINDVYFNDPEYPRYLASSWDHLTYWKDGTQNTKTLPDGSANPDFNGGKNNGAVVREGIQIIRNKDKEGRTIYYATFTFMGVGAVDYDVHWASSYSPLGVTGDEYTLPKGFGRGTILGVDANNDFMSNLGHVQFLNVDAQWWICHWEWTVPFGYATSTDIGRIYALSQMTWIEDDGCDVPVPVANGPSTKLQALPSVYSGYRNIAADAKITATNAVGNTQKYLNDGLVVTMNNWQEMQFVANGSTEITIEFDKPRTIRGILIYNSYLKENAFSKVSSIRFELSETPSWRKGGSETTCYIKDLGFDATDYQAGSAAIATFGEITVKKITVVVDSLINQGKQLKISEIQVLGK